MYFDRGSFKVTTNIDKNLKKFEKFKNTLYDPSGTLTKALYDIKGRAPGRVANAVCEIYNIKKSDIMPKKKKIKKNESAKKLKRAGYISLNGTTISELILYYSGRPLTLTHFDFSPKKVPQKRGYKVEEKIRKVPPLEKEPPQKPNNKSNPFILKSPQGIVMPFQRRLDKANKKNPCYKKKDKSDGRMNQAVISERTVSLPQMVDDEQARKIMNQALGELYNERLHHHVGDLWDKCCSEN